jgi:catechol 2,3-dioxygenase-like lactoylglutathione lyase family enzyme
VAILLRTIKQPGISNTKEPHMRNAALFIAGMVVGLAVQAAIAQNQNRGIVGLNHVALSVPNLDEALTYYTKTMGFPEAFRSTDEKGQVALVYVQISKNTFVELQPANPQRPPCREHECRRSHVQTTRSKRNRTESERDEGDSVEYRRSQWRPHRTG